jgi:hypothetical protein
MSDFLRKKLMKTRMALVCILGLGLSGCYVAESAYYPDYDEDYVYSVGYYGYRPYDWGDGYYATYGWGTRDWVDAPRTRYVEKAYYSACRAPLRRYALRTGCGCDD